MRKILATIDSISDWTGKTARWLTAILVLVMTYEVTMRYAFDSPTMWAYETSIMLGATIYALFWSYTHRHHSHVRVDVFYTRLSPRGKAVIDVLGTFFLFIPLLSVFAGTAVAWAWKAWVINEKMVETYWYPPSAPLRTVVAVGICLFALQCIAQFVRDVYFLIRNKPYD